MTELEINKLIHEKVMGEKWIEETALCNCPSCSNPRYTSSWADYGPMVEECMKKGWWNEFITNNTFFFVQDPVCEDIMDSVSLLLDPFRGATAIAEFVLANPEYFEEKEDGR